MRNAIRMLWMFPVLLILAGCEDAPRAVDPDAGIYTARGNQPADARARNLVAWLFPGGEAKDEAMALLDVLVASDGAAARTAAVDLAALVLGEHGAGNLRQLPGLAAPPLEEGVAELVDLLYALAGMDPPELPAGVLTDPDAGFGAIGEDGGLVLTPSKLASVEAPPGALPEPVLVVITPLENFSLPTSLPQFGPYFDIAIYPHPPEGTTGLVLGNCFDEDLTPSDAEMRVGLVDPSDASRTIVLPPRPASGLDCHTAFAQRSGGPVARLLTRLAQALAPTTLVARSHTMGGGMDTLTVAGPESEEDIRVLGVQAGAVDASGELPDLVVSRLSVSPANPSILDVVEFTIEVSNIDIAPAGPSITRTRVVGEFGVDIPTPALDYGQSVTFTRRLSVGIPDAHTLDAFADFHLDVQESNEGNNLMVTEFAVSDVTGGGTIEVSLVDEDNQPSSGVLRLKRCRFAPDFDTVEPGGTCNVIQFIQQLAAASGLVSIPVDAGIYEVQLWEPLPGPTILFRVAPDAVVSGTLVVP